MIKIMSPWHLYNSGIHCDIPTLWVRRNMYGSALVVISSSLDSFFIVFSKLVDAPLETETSYSLEESKCRADTVLSSSGYTEHAGYETIR